MEKGIWGMWERSERAGVERWAAGRTHKKKQEMMAVLFSMGRVGSGFNRCVVGLPSMLRAQAWSCWAPDVGYGGSRSATMVTDDAPRVQQIRSGDPWDGVESFPTPRVCYCLARRLMGRQVNGSVEGKGIDGGAIPDQMCAGSVALQSAVGNEC